MKSKFQVKYLESYIVEIFGNQQVKDPILLKNISQKVKYNLKRLGSSLQEELKNIREELKTLFEKYAVEALPEYTEEQKKSAEDGAMLPKLVPQKRVPEEKKEEFLKEAAELENMEVEIEHAEFTEADFMDKATNEMIGGSIYFNVIDTVLGWNSEEEKKEEIAQIKN